MFIHLNKSAPIQLFSKYSVPQYSVPHNQSNRFLLFSQKTQKLEKYILCMHMDVNYTIPYKTTGFVCLRIVCNRLLVLCAHFCGSFVGFRCKSLLQHFRYAQQKGRFPEQTYKWLIKPREHKYYSLIHRLLQYSKQNFNTLARRNQIRTNQNENI